MNIRNLNLGIIFLALLVLVFAASLVLFLFAEKWERRVLFFPEIKSHKMVSEVRYLPKQPTLNADVDLLVQDLLLGPSNYNNGAMFPSSAQYLGGIHSVREKAVYLNFSRGFYLPDALVPVTPKEMLQSLADTVLFNFPSLVRVIVFIDGQPLSPDYSRGRDSFFRMAMDFVPLKDLSTVRADDKTTVPVLKLLAEKRLNPLFSYFAGEPGHMYDFSNGIGFSNSVLK